MQADGSIIIDTKILDGGMEKGFEAIKDEMQSVGITAEKVGNQISLSFSKMDVSKPIANAKAKIEGLEQRLSAVTTQLKEAQYADDDRAAQSLDMQRLRLYDQLEAARKKLVIEISTAAKKEADAEVREAKRAAAAKKREEEKRYKAATKGARMFGNRLSSIAFGALVFNLVSAGLREVTRYFGKALRSNTEFTQSLSRLKGALLTAFQPIYEIVLPAIISLINVLTIFAQAVGHIFSILGGKSDSQMAKNAAALNKQANAIGGVGGAAEKAKRQLAGFDEINKLESNEPNTGGGGGGTDIGANFTDFDTEKYKAKIDELTAYVSASLLALGAILAFSGANIPLGIALMALGAVGLVTEIATNWSAIKESLQGPMGEVVGVISTAFLVLGAIFAFSGSNIPLGIALMAMGATALATVSVVNWDALKTALQGPAGEITAYISGLLLVIGAILAFSNANLPLGIALLAAGAVGLVTTAALNWNSIKEFLKNSIDKIAGILGMSLLVIGGVLAFSNANLPLGIALMAAGAVGLGTAAVLNWDTIREKMQGPLGEVAAILSGVLIATGAIIAFSNANLPLGIGLMAAGAVGLGATAAINWDTIKQKLQGPLGGVVAIVSAALLALGAVLTFTGAALPLGIGLMVAGAAGLGATAALNWDGVKQKITSVLAGILAVISGASIVLGVLLCLSGAGIGVGLALIFAGIAGSVAAWNIDDNPITRFVKNIANGIISIVNTVIDAINGMFHIKFNGLKIAGKELIPAFDRQLVNVPKIPALAQGAVLPANQPFLAMVGDQRHGTNIEAPLSTIQEAVALVMQDQTAAIMAGFNASVEVQREILSAVLGIQIGDDVIASAYERYQSKMAIQRGG